MATAPIPPGGIVSVPDPITGGAGAPVLVSQVFNAKWANAIQLLNASSYRNDTAIALTDPAPTLAGVTLDQSYLPPLKPTLQDNNPADAKAIYDDTAQDINDFITNAFVGFLAEYFPNTAYFDAAMDWIETAITSGGTGINPYVEGQLWERGKGRILMDSQRLEDEAMSVFANRGFPLPPGALASGLQQIRLDASRKLAEQSRDISIESFKAELENIRFAVGQAIDLRMKSFQAVGDYIRTLMEGPKTAMALATSMVSLRTEANRSLVALYTAESAALDPRVRLAISAADLQLRGQEANLRSQNASIDSRVRATLAGAQQVASVAAASLNGINASASISGSDTTSL